MSTFDDLALRLAEHLYGVKYARARTAMSSWSSVPPNAVEFEIHDARRALEAIGLPALLEYVEAAEAEVACWQKATFEREAAKNAAEGRARIAETKTADAAERIALAIEAEADREEARLERDAQGLIGNWIGGIRVGAHIARAALTEAER